MRIELFITTFMLIAAAACGGAANSAQTPNGGKAADGTGLAQDATATAGAADVTVGDGGSADAQATAALPDGKNLPSGQFQAAPALVQPAASADTRTSTLSPSAYRWWARAKRAAPTPAAMLNSSAQRAATAARQTSASRGPEWDRNVKPQTNVGLWTPNASPRRVAGPPANFCRAKERVATPKAAKRLSTWPACRRGPAAATTNALKSPQSAASVPTCATRIPNAKAGSAPSATAD